ncbi:2-C-methyl-D-erythritol 2,4-cyclodiphosphate synthase [Patescibacteria group bacterium]|nr:2-C-methyl-D-erythritol 2,4-cyclodiphosphate synthase [Patescibacteria group bacterium]
MKIGIGQDSHPFDSHKKLYLGGIVISKHPGLKGNSDSDVVLHALCNALTSAVGQGSLATYSDKMCQSGITDSQEYVKTALNFVTKNNYQVNNVSISIEALKPKLEKHFPAMKKSISKILNIAENSVGITATSGEHLTTFGKGQGIQAFAAVTIIKKT